MADLDTLFMANQETHRDLQLEIAKKSAPGCARNLHQETAGSL